MSMDYQSPVIIDNGSGSCRAGLSGDDAPRVSFQPMVGTPKYQQKMPGFKAREFFIGDDAR